MLSLVFQILLLVFGVFLIIAVLFQHGKSYGLSGTIAGGAETFFGKEKGTFIDRVLARATTIVGVLFVLLVLSVYVLQRDYNAKYDYTYGVGDYSDYYGQMANVSTLSSGTKAPAATTADPSATTAGAATTAEPTGSQ